MWQIVDKKDYRSKKKTGAEFYIHSWLAWNQNQESQRFIVKLARCHALCFVKI